jgi:UDP-glucuronate decarboxylase
MVMTCQLAARILDGLRGSDHTIVILGPTGWMGSATLAMLDLALGGAVLSQRVRVFGSADRDIVLPSGTIVRCQALSAMPHTDISRAIVLHYAYATKDKLTSLSDAAFMQVNTHIQTLVAEAIEIWRPAALFFPSSGAVYGPGGLLVETPAHNLYGWMKRQDEENLRALTARLSIRLYIARVFTLSGEYINKTNLYALACFLNDIKSGGPIRILADHPVLRSYAYIGDVVNLALALLLDLVPNISSDIPLAPLVFDVAGSQVVEMQELAGLCRVVCGCPDRPILRPDLDTERVSSMIGDSTEYGRLLQVHGLDNLPLQAQVRATGRWLGALACGYTG